ncbi:DUF6266 family protein [Pedobacter cryoconitis]|uniref:Uncharacterized protein n=1 Tax=Pedobacter cryoconitis TaxID=188932 RepID=A0A7X0MJ96_9SPHI|nr:DUF6266 family protein [Pedobacter cryoconitis]MBB6501242.1 hypothetical protein [Pedobacter cryoconitis]
MAILRKGSDEGFTGKIGNTVTYRLYGKTVKRTIGIRTDKPTVPVLSSWQATAVTSAFLKSVREFIKIGFELAAKQVSKSYYDVAASYTRLNAITGTYPLQHIDFTKVLLSKGKMPLTPMTRVKATDDSLLFSWDSKFTAHGIKASDQAMLLVYLPEKRVAIHQLNAAKRAEGFGYLQMPKTRAPLIAETYISFISENHKSISNSIYTGQITWQTD